MKRDEGGRRRFGRSAAVCGRSDRSPNAPTGRVLRVSSKASTRLRFLQRRSRRNPSRSCREKSRDGSSRPVKSRARPKTPTFGWKGVAPQDFVKPAAIVSQPIRPTAAEPDREPRSLRKRRLLDAELKAGERWNDDLCKPRGKNPGTAARLPVEIAVSRESNESMPELPEVETVRRGLAPIFEGSSIFESNCAARICVFRSAEFSGEIERAARRDIAQAREISRRRTG